MNLLTINQKNQIADAILNRRNCIFFRVPEFNNSIVLQFGETRDAQNGDMQHYLAHGATIGGAAYASRRQQRWKGFSENVYQGALEKGLSVYRSKVVKGTVSNANIEQVIVVGNRYMSIYMFGEANKKEIYYNNICQISYDNNLGLSIVSKFGDKYVVYYVYENVPRLAELAIEIINYVLRTK